MQFPCELKLMSIYSYSFSYNTDLSHSFFPPLFLTFVPQFETNDTLQCSSDSFPRMVTYILCVENCQNTILMHSCLPIETVLECEKISLTHDLRVQHNSYSRFDFFLQTAEHIPLLLLQVCAKS